MGKTMTAKTVLITGCSSGIGLATAEYFQQRGWNVSATMRNPDADSKNLKRLDDTICPKLDVNDTATIKSAIDETIRQFGSIDVVVNNAGYALMGAFETLDKEQIRRQFDTNVFGLMEVCREILPYFRDQKSGTLINVSSMVGRVPLPFYSVYNASKHAVEGFTEGLVYELEPFNVNVKIIEPGAVNTDFFGRSSDRANATGESAYHDHSSWRLQTMDRFGPGGSDSVDVARVIWNAANDSSNKLRYAVGIDAKGIMAARQLLPGATFRSLIKFGLSPAFFDTIGQHVFKPAEAKD